MGVALVVRQVKTTTTPTSVFRSAEPLQGIEKKEEEQEEEKKEEEKEEGRRTVFHAAQNERGRQTCLPLKDVAHADGAKDSGGGGRRGLY
jgi:hypothetical protein